LNTSTFPWEDDPVSTRPRRGTVPTAEPDPAEELGGRLLRLSWIVQEHLSSTAAGFGLTHQQAWLLRILDEPRPMGELAAMMRCDASNLTGIVDRLEARGLLERHVDERDRRIKRLVVTPAGRALRRRFEERLFSEMPRVADLTEAERRRLLSLLRRLTPEVC
jgi:DNA-binding MarR family transcriptional regulator